LGRIYTRNASRFPKNVEYGDIVKGLPVPDNSCEAVYCSHVLEHLSLEACRKALANTFKMLDRGGTFRLVVPDLEILVRNYVGDQRPEAASTFLRDSRLGRETRKRGVFEFLKDWMGNSEHLWMWDYKGLEQELARRGFVNIRRASLGDSTEIAFADVEDLHRWQDCLGVECTRPSDD
jgi:predicted SAM-dependent methyltransferase